MNIYYNKEYTCIYFAVVILEMNVVKGYKTSKVGLRMVLTSSARLEVKPSRDDKETNSADLPLLTK